MEIWEAEDELKRLVKRNHRLTWDGRYWGKGGALEIAPRICELKQLVGSAGEAIISAASTYYSAFGHAATKTRSTAMSHPMKMVWIWRAAWTYLLACLHVRDFILLVNKGEYYPAPSEYDVAGSIYAVIPHQYVRRVALDLFKAGVNEARFRWKGPREEMDKSSALLFVKIGRTHALLGDYIPAAAYINQAIDQLDEHTEATTAVRVYRDAGDFFWTQGDIEDVDEGIRLVDMALKIAHAADLTDAVLKIKGVYRKHGYTPLAV